MERVYNENNMFQLAEEVVNTYDYNTLIEAAIATVWNDFQQDEDAFYEAWEIMYGDPNEQEDE
jgi:hypothetical protein